MLIVVVVFALTASTTKPSSVGLDWIPFMLLSMPWYALDVRLPNRTAQHVMPFVALFPREQMSQFAPPHAQDIVTEGRDPTGPGRSLEPGPRRPKPFRFALRN